MAQRKEKKYNSWDKEVTEDKEMIRIFKQWDSKKVTKDPTRYGFILERWRNVLEPNKSQDKEEFIRQMQDGFELTENKNIKCDQGELEFKQTLEDWRFLAKSITEYMGEEKNCVWGPLWEKQTKENILKGSNIMPHFIDHKLKPDGTTKLRVVTDASKSKIGGKAFNDNISKDESWLQYINLRNVVEMIVLCDIKYLIMADAVNAFNRVPIAEKFIKYFGIHIAGYYFFWTCLVFGGSSSCRIYAWFAAHVVWILVYYNQHIFVINGITVLRNYLDDFIAGHKTLRGAWMQYAAILVWFAFLGIPTQVKKMQIPTRIMKYIGYILNLVQQEVEIPWDKLANICIQGEEIIQKIDKAEKIRVREFQSFNGVSRFATPVYYYLPPFLRNIEYLIGSRDKNELVYGNEAIKKDIQKIISIIKATNRNKISFKWLLYPKDKGDIITETDASGKFGMGGLEKRESGVAYMVRYKDIKGWTKVNEPDIVWKELCAVWILHKMQKEAWEGKAILLKVDNKAVEHICIKKKACFERKDLQILIRNICEDTMIHNLWHWYTWISTTENKYADGLSRGKTDILKELPYNLIRKH